MTAVSSGEATTPSSPESWASRASRTTWSITGTVTLASASVAAKKNAVLQVGHVQRYSPAFKALASRIDKALYIDAERLAGFGMDDAPRPRALGP